MNEWWQYIILAVVCMLAGGFMMGFLYAPNWYAAGKRHASDYLGDMMPLREFRWSLLWPGTWPYVIAYYWGGRVAKRHAQNTRHI